MAGKTAPDKQPGAPMPLTIATWNINSVRLRMPIVERFLRQHRPDVLCLQETTCIDELFPLDAFASLGSSPLAISCQKGYHGVATVARRPLQVVERRRFCDNDDCRHLSTRIVAGGGSLLLHNFYVPAGGDEPDPDIASTGSEIDCARIQLMSSKPSLTGM